MRCISCLSPSVPGHQELGRLSDRHEDSTKHNVHKQWRTQPQLCPRRPDTLLHANLWVDHSLSDTVNQTGMNVKRDTNKKSLWDVCNTTVGEGFLWSRFKTGSQSNFHSWTHKTLQGSNVTTVQKTLCGGRVESNYCDSILSGKKSQLKLRFSKITWVSLWNKQPFLFSLLQNFLLNIQTIL